MDVGAKSAGRRGWVGGLLAVAALGTQALAAQDGLTERINAALARLGPHAVYGVRVVSAPDGAVLYERNADLSLNPASNMKVLTSTAALARLGPEYRFTTTVLAAGKVTDGVLDGALAIRGGGDPVLETPGLAELADAVKQAGVREVRGDLLADDYRFDAERLGEGWNWDDEPYYYSAEISALSVNRNVLLVDVAPAEAGNPALVTLKPLPDYGKVLLQPTTGPAGSPTRVEITRERGRNEIRVTGSIAADGRAVRDQEVTVEEPELYAAALFRKLLAERGITVSGPVRRAPTPADAASLATHVSPPLSAIVALLNKPSDNLVAEMLLKELGYASKKSGDAASGAAAVSAFLKERGIDAGGVSIHDGSGLSRKDLVTARVMTDLLARADREPWREAFFQSLPIAGVDGTLRSRLKGTPAEKNVHAKTGSLSHVSALSGYATTSGGRRVAFSILTNNFTGEVSAKRVEDAIAVALAESH